MKTFGWRHFGAAISLSLGLLVSLVQGVSGQTNTYPFPVVTVVATDPIATRSGDTGTFTFFRAGSTNESLMVYYNIEGTASNGVDYVHIGNFVTIPAGIRTNAVVITPINSGQTDALQTVVVELGPSPLMIPVNYTIGYPSNAVVYIKGNGSVDIPPVVNIVSPINGAIYYSPVSLSLIAKAADPDGVVTNVEFFAGTNDLGRGFQVVLDPPGVNGVTGLVFFFLWNNVPPGNYPLTAVATDDGGVSTVSATVNITVLTGPPPTNLPPVVRIISPSDGAIFRAPVDIPIFAYAQDPDGRVSQVEFFAGTNDLGPAAPLPCPTPAIICSNCPRPICPSNIFFLIWSNAPLGAYPLTAVAADNAGASTVSAPVKVTILPPPPPPTNNPPIVSIVAIDPVAIEGTNCFPWVGLTNATPTWANWTTTPTALGFFTNCGPKNATFAVRRFGVTNNDLTVSYAVGGTATNGVEYVLLWGTVTIPAGERRALISVVPVDDGPPDITSTVILKLVASTNYVIGFPPAAAAIIIDSNWPWPATAALPDGCFHVNATGPEGAWFSIQVSSDLLNWTSVCTNQVVNGSIDFVDPDAQGTPAKFYRAVPQVGVPME